MPIRPASASVAGHQQAERVRIHQRRPGRARTPTALAVVNDPRRPSSSRQQRQVTRTSQAYIRASREYDDQRRAERGQPGRPEARRGAERDAADVEAPAGPSRSRRARSRPARRPPRSRTRPIHPSSSIGCIGARVASIRKSRSMTADGLPARASRIVTTSSYQKLSRPSWYPRRPAATATIAARINPMRHERRRSRTRAGRTRAADHLDLHSTLR